jgi:hypothetical protein
MCQTVVVLHSGLDQSSKTAMKALLNLRWIRRRYQNSEESFCRSLKYKIHGPIPLLDTEETTLKVVSKQRTIQLQVIAGCADLFQEAVKKEGLSNIYVHIARKLRPATGTEHKVKEICGSHMRNKTIFFSISRGNPHMLRSFY